MAERGFGAKALALEAAAAQTRHFGGRCGLVEEDQPVGFEPHPGLPLSRPFLTRLSDVGTIAFAGQQFFFKAVAIADEPARERGWIGPRAAACFKLACQSPAW